MSCTYSHGREFVRQMRPALERRDLGGFVRQLRQHWSNERLVELLNSGHEDAIKVALVALCISGTMAENRAVAALLHDDDPYTVSLAERALWSIWFQSGDDRSRRALARAVRLIDAQQLGAAISLLDAVIRRYPDLVEAYNQRAIAWFLKGDFVQSKRDCASTLRLNPYHFGALAGLGHCFVVLGDLPRALKAYHRTLAVHPRLEGIRQSIRRVRECLKRPQPTSAHEIPAP